jgi:hypothetical protein
VDQRARTTSTKREGTCQPRGIVTDAQRDSRSIAWQRTRLGLIVELRFASEDSRASRVRRSAELGSIAIYEAGNLPSVIACQICDHFTVATRTPNKESLWGHAPLFPLNFVIVA